MELSLDFQGFIEGMRFHLVCLHDTLVVNQSITERIWAIDEIFCPLCGNQTEIMTHLLVACYRVRSTLSTICPLFFFQQYVNAFLQNFFQDFLVWTRTFEDGEKILATIYIGFWHTWLCRNDLVFKQ